MSEETLEVTEDLTPPTDTESVTTEQEATPEPVNDDTATSTEEDKPSRAEQRIQQLVGDKKAAMEYGNFWKDKFEQSHAPAPEVIETPAPLVMPKLEDFDHDTDKWAAAITDYNAQFINQAVNQGVSTALDVRVCTPVQSYAVPAGFLRFLGGLFTCLGRGRTSGCRP